MGYFILIKYNIYFHNNYDYFIQPPISREEVIKYFTYKNRSQKNILPAVFCTVHCQRNKGFVWLK